MAKRKTHKCARCDRKFSMAAHLARHMNTVHGSKKIKASKRASAGPRANRGSEGDFRVLLGGLKAYRDRIADQRNEIDNQMRTVDAALAGLGVANARPALVGRRSGGGARAGSLKDYIARVLRGLARGKSVQHIAAAVLKAGYKSKDKKLDHSVGKALAGMKNVTRVERGVYRLK